MESEQRDFVNGLLSRWAHLMVPSMGAGEGCRAFACRLWRCGIAQTGRLAPVASRNRALRGDAKCAETWLASRTLALMCGAAWGQPTLDHHQVAGLEVTLAALFIPAPRRRPSFAACKE